MHRKVAALLDGGEGDRVKGKDDLRSEGQEDAGQGEVNEGHSETVKATPGREYDLDRAAKQQRRGARRSGEWPANHGDKYVCPSSHGRGLYQHGPGLWYLPALVPERPI